MGTATSRAARLALGSLVLIGAAGCGAARQMPARSAKAGALATSIRAAAPPAGWHGLRITTGAVLFYPPGWKPARGDLGTATATLEGADRRLLGYLNITPQQGGETLANWSRFRVAHNAREGDREVKPEAISPRVRFRTGTGTCVRDRYTTVSGARYIELACLVEGRSATSVIVAASSPAAWDTVSPSLYRALSAMTT
jgi:hypothetical protein